LLAVPLDLEHTLALFLRAHSLDRLSRHDSGTNVVFFVLRFVYDHLSDESWLATGWHGLIRHVQSNEEQRFTRWADVTAFIARYVSVGEDIADMHQES
jgi:hypothetical protein